MLRFVDAFRSLRLLHRLSRELFPVLVFDVARRRFRNDVTPLPNGDAFEECRGGVGLPRNKFARGLDAVSIDDDQHGRGQAVVAGERCVFREEFGATPAAFVEKLRLETAVRLVEESNRSLEEIAEACGLGSVDAMRRAFVKSFGATAFEMR